MRKGEVVGVYIVEGGVTVRGGERDLPEIVKSEEDGGSEWECQLGRGGERRGGGGAAYLPGRLSSFMKAVNTS